MKNYITLSISIVSEVLATTMLKFSDGFTNLLPAVIAVIGYLLSFYALGIALKKLPLSLVYAIWAGVGTTLTALVSVLVWNEALTAFKISGMLLIIAGVVILNTSTSKPNRNIT